MAFELTEEELIRLVALREGGLKINQLDSMIKMRKLFDLHALNPTFTRADLVDSGFSAGMVREYWAMFVKSKPVYQMREWSEVMNNEGGD